VGFFGFRGLIWAKIAEVGTDLKPGYSMQLSSKIKNKIDNVIEIILKHI